MNRFWSIIDAPFKYLCVGLIYFYKGTINQITPKTCIYQPTCSTYTLIAVKRFGSIKGCWIGLKRLVRCTPKHKGGTDPVPDNINGSLKYKI